MELLPDRNPMNCDTCGRTEEEKKQFCMSCKRNFLYSDYWKRKKLKYDYERH